MMEEGVLREADPGQLAAEFYAPLFLLISIYDRAGDREKAIEILNNHIGRFIENNAAEDRRN